MSSVKIAVRVRPFNSREKDNNSFNVIQMKNKSTGITNPRDKKDTKTFTFDYSYWSMDASEPQYANQDMVQTDLGRDMLGHAFDGYNTCIFAYGQTGSGKSYTMLGGSGYDQRGIIPRTCEELFDRIVENSTDELKFKVEVSYFEIYCEKVKDLLNPKNKGNLRVREHPALGPYVEGLMKLPVMDYKQIFDLMELGNKTRTVAATDMNAVSSRSHAVFTLIFSQSEKDESSQMWGEKVSKISLVDLAGSERADSTGATGDRLKEGAEINKSLTTLGRVIHALADLGKKGAEKPPFRDSVLTYILKESLGGNSKTTMVAALSPADINYDETLSTLRFADRAKQIMCKAMVNEDPNARMIRLLKEEILKLRQIIIQEDLVEKVRKLGLDISRPPGYTGSKGIKGATPASTPNTPSLSISDGIQQKQLGQEIGKEEDEELKQVASNMVRSPSVSISAEAAAEQIKESQRLMDDLTKDWKDKLDEAEKHKTETEHYMHNLGIALSVGEDGVETVKGVFSPKNTPHLVNLNEDPLMSECLIYYLKDGVTRVGRSEGCDINLHGNYILPEHCQFENERSKVRLVPQPGSNTFVNGNRITETTELKQGSRVILGVHHVFRFNNPEEAKKHRSSVLSFLDSSAKADYTLNQKNVQRSRRSHGSSTGNWNPNQQPDELLDPYYRSSSPSSDYFSSRDEGERSYTPTSMMTPYDFDYAQDELMRIQGLQGNQMVQELVEEQTTQIKKELDEARHELDEQRKQADAYKQAYDELMDTQSVNSTGSSPTNDYSEEEPNFQDEQRVNLLRCLGKWKDYRYNEIRDSLFDNAVLLKEANAISVELRQQVAFQFILLTDCPYAHLPETLALGLDCETEDPENPSSPRDSSSLRKTIVAVEVSDARCGVTHIWSLEKLKQRIFAMQEMYEAFAKLETISPLIKACNIEDRGKDPLNASSGNNPFFDRNPWYSLIGRSYVYLTHMLIPISLEQTVAIVTDQGNVVGHIDILVELCEEEDGEAKDIKPTTVAFEKSNSVWYPKEIPVYPYRQSDLIEQCYLSPDKLSEIIERPRKISSPPKPLGRSQSHTQKDIPPSSHRKRMSRVQSSDPKSSSSDLVISPREESDPSDYFSGENSLRLTSSAREIRHLNEEDRFSVSEKGSNYSLRSDEMVRERSLCSSADNITNSANHAMDGGEDEATPLEHGQRKSSYRPIEHSSTLLTEPEPKDDLDTSEPPDHTPINEERLKPELSINFQDLVSPTRLQPPPLSELSVLRAEPTLPAGPHDGEDPSREGSETMSSSDYFSETSSYFEPSRVSAPHLKIGQYVKVKVKVLRVKNLDKNCASVLLQNRFLYENQEPYSSLLYSNDGQCCEINHVHIFRIKVTLPFLDYIKNRGFMIELFGHYEQHPLHFESTSDQFEFQYDRRNSHTIPPVKSSVPSRTALTVPYQSVSSAQPVARYDVIMNLQICELNQQGDYIPVPVTHVRETNGSFFLLQQGLQRRLVLSFVYDSNIELKMKKVKEVVVGRIRHHLKPIQEEEDSSLTLNVSSADFIDLNNDSRTVFRIQAAWDTSLHHTKLLNMSTPPSVLVYATMSVYIEMENCTQTACFTINFSLQITNRQQKGFHWWDSFFTPQHRPENNCVVGLYEVALQRSTEANARKRNAPYDIQSVYVRGEENLKGWQPRGISLIQEHQNQVKRLREIEQVERAKHVLSIREKMSSGKNMHMNYSVDDLLNRCLYLWKFQISPFLQDNLTVEDLLKHPHSEMYGTRSETPQRRCVPFVHDISHKKSNLAVKRGFIQLSEYEGLWRKFYAVLKRPYIYLYYNDKDPIERDFINLATAKLQFNHDQLDAQTGASVFSLCTKYRGFLCKTQDFDGWINALDPLTSGAMVSKKSMDKKNSINLLSS